MGLLSSETCVECRKEIKKPSTPGSDSSVYSMLKNKLLCYSCFQEKYGEVLDASINAKYHGGESGIVAGGTFSDFDGGSLVLTEDNLLYKENSDNYTIEIPLKNVLPGELGEKEYNQVGGIWSGTFKGKEIVIPYEDEKGKREAPRFSIRMGKTKAWAQQIYNQIDSAQGEISAPKEDEEDLLAELDERLAKGEISEDTYKRVRERLEKGKEKEKIGKRKKVEEEKETKEEGPEAVFYAQPREKLRIKWDKFKQGKIEESTFSRYNVTDIVTYTIEALKRICDIESFFVKGRTPKGNKAAILNIDVGLLKLNLKEEMYKGVMKGNAKNFYVSIKLKGNKDKISEFIDIFTKRADYPPWEMDDWEEFTSETGVSRDEVIKSWKKYQAKEEIDETEETIKRCPECGAELEPDAEFCIHCGAKIEGGKKD